MARVSGTVWGRKMVHSYSTVLTESKKKARHSSMAFLLEYFLYLSTLIQKNKNVFRTAIIFSFRKNK